MENFNWEYLANWAIDALLETWSPSELCESLYHAGFDREELLFLGFDEETVDEAAQTVEAQLNWFK